MSVGRGGKFGGLNGQRTIDAKRIVATLSLRVAVVVVVATGAFYLFDHYTDIRLTDSMAIRQSVENVGMAGPLLIITLIAMAIVMTPIPSAPIALAAGATYGHIWGSLYVAIGAGLGALTAFGIARFVGYDAITARFGTRIASIRLLGSQTALMWTVFATRLVPFISFDIVSYAAGLTPLTAWRFALATMLGIIPASFVLAHFGTEITSADPTRIMVAILALGLVTGAPFVAAVIRRRKGRRATGPGV